MSYGLETMKQKLEFTIPRVGADEYGLGTRWHIINLDILKIINGSEKFFRLKTEDFYTFNDPRIYVKVDKFIKIYCRLGRSTTTQKAYLDYLLIEGNTIIADDLPRISGGGYGLYANGRYLNSLDTASQETYSIQTKGYNTYKEMHKLWGYYLNVLELLKFFRKTIGTDANHGLGSTFSMDYRYSVTTPDGKKADPHYRIVVLFYNLYQQLNLLCLNYREK